MTCLYTEQSVTPGKDAVKLLYADPIFDEAAAKFGVHLFKVGSLVEKIGISGGTVGDVFFAGHCSVVNVFGSEFSIDGVELDTLVPGEAFTITGRDMTLSGFFVDGEQFSFQLSPDPSFSSDSFDPDATLTVTLGSPAGPVLLGDVNQDGVVFDIPAFIAILLGS